MFQEQIARGVALLDQKVPGWLERIDVDRLDMNWPHFPAKDNWRYPGCGCVLAQLDDAGVADRLSRALDLGCDVSDKCAEHGFAVGDDGSGSYPDLTAEWKAEILRLRAERA